MSQPHPPLPPPSEVRLLPQLRVRDSSRGMAIALAIGVASGVGAVVFMKLIELFQWISWGSATFTLEQIAHLEWYWFIIIPGLGGAIVAWFVNALAKEAKGHGVPEVMAAVALRDGVIRPRVALVKTLASALTIGTGGSVGQEGPIVQIGSAIGSALGQTARVSSRKLRTFVGCGAAAGIAATFNAPMAGVVFALEVILKDFGVVQFGPLVVASVTATAIARLVMGNIPVYQVPEYHLVSVVEFLPYAILGVLAGVVSVVFIKILYALEDGFDRMVCPEWSKGLLGGALLGCIALWYPQVLGTGHQSIHRALTGEAAGVVLLVLVAAKLLASSLTLSSGGSGGIFAPSLFLGAMLGGAVGRASNILLPSYTAESGAYAIVAMGAVVAGTTRAPMTAILIIFEMTNDYHPILPLMLTCIVAHLIASRLDEDSIYTKKLRHQGIALDEGRESNVLRKIPVKSCISTDTTTINPTMTLPEILTIAARSSNSSFYVVDDDRRPIGVVARHQLWQWLAPDETPPENVTATDLSSSAVWTISSDETLDDAARVFSACGDDEIAVIDPSQGGRLVGTLWQTDLMAAYYHRLFYTDTASELARRIKATVHMSVVELEDGYALARIAIPSEWVGKTVYSLDIRQRHNLTILFTIHGTEDKRQLVTADTILERGDAILVMGPSDAVKEAISG